MASDIGSVDLIIRLSHELGVALEFSFDGAELRALWPEAIDALRESMALLKARGIIPPEAASNVVHLFDNK